MKPIDQALVDRARQLRHRAGPVGDGSGEFRLVRSEDNPDITVIQLYDEVGFSFFGGGVSADQFVKELRDIKTPQIELHINSPGGDVFDGVAIYNALLAHPAEIHVIVDGLAASAASFIATAGDRVSMGRATELMIHDAYTFTIGNEREHLEVADVLSQISGSIAGLYADRAGGDADQWRERMRTETWYTADEAVAAGLADQVASRDGEPVNSAWLSGFRYAGRAKAPEPTRPLETASPVHHTATVDRTWDASVHEGRLPSPMTVATARSAYAWYDGSRVEDGEIIKDGCKLPHHEVSEDGSPGVANLSGVRNALSRLSQSDIPESEQDAARRHLQAHLDDAPEDRASLDDMLARADALLEGRDPDAVADPFDTARITGRLAAQRDLQEINAQ